MVTNLFNGKVYVKPLTKSGSSFNVGITFQDETSYFKGSDAQIGDVLFVRAMTGRYFRLFITAIQFQNYRTINATVIDPTNGGFTYLVAQHCALVRETPIRKYPMFPPGIPPVLRGAMESYYAVLADYQDSCSGDLITASDVQGTETICLENEDGTQSKIALSELRKYMHTWKTPNGNDYFFDKVTDAGQLEGSTPPQY